jgi:anaerobic selenocysteine-containing dehydrogenase
MTAPGMRVRLREIRERGGRIIVIDPRRSETADLADEHHFIRPGTDPLLLAALIRCLFAEGRVQIGDLEPHVRGLDVLEEAVADFAPEAVTERVGIAAEAIHGMARAFAEAPTAVCYGRMGTSTVPFGTTTSWLIEALNIISGNLDRPGGAMFANPPVDVLKLQPATERGRWRSRTRGTPEFMGELPTATLTEEIETPGEPQVRALVTLAGNPVLSSPAGHRLSDALGKLDFMVSIDFYLNETTRHASVILPPVGPLERDHFDLAFQLLSVRNTTRWSPAVFEPPDDTRNDAEILLALATRLFRKRGVSGQAKALGLRALSALGGERASRVVLDLALRTGPHGNGMRPWREGVTVKRLRGSLHGLDLGPLSPCLPDRLPSRPDGSGPEIDIAPKEIVADLARLRASLTEAQPPLVLIGRREMRTVNSWSHNLPSLVKGRMRCVLQIHPSDAEAHCIRSGDRVRVTSRVGVVEVPAELTDAVMRGVVSLPHGYGHRAPGIRLKVAAEHAGASINDLTDPDEIDPLSGTAVLSGVPVRVERC